jgi:hypothetical protein
LKQEVIACSRHGMGTTIPYKFKEKAYRFFIFSHKKHFDKESVIKQLYYNGKLSKDEAVRVLGYHTRFLS